MFSFHKNYFFWTLILLFVEVFIGAYMHDALIRPYGGDFLVVILLYCLVKSFTNFRVRTAAIGVLLFSYLVETLQYFHIVNLLGLEQSRIACIIIGTSFAWSDLLAYTLGILVVLAAEEGFGKVVTKYKITPLKIFSVYLIGLCAYLFVKRDSDELEILFAYFLIFAIVATIGIDFFFQANVKNTWRMWAFESLSVVVFAWFLGIL